MGLCRAHDWSGLNPLHLIKISSSTSFHLTLHCADSFCATETLNPALRSLAQHLSIFKSQGLSVFSNFYRNKNDFTNESLHFWSYSFIFLQTQPFTIFTALHEAPSPAFQPYQTKIPCRYLCLPPLNFWQFLFLYSLLFLLQWNYGFFLHFSCCCREQQRYVTKNIWFYFRGTNIQLVFRYVTVLITACFLVLVSVGPCIVCLALVILIVGC